MSITVNMSKYTPNIAKTIACDEKKLIDKTWVGWWQ